MDGGSSGSMEIDDVRLEVREPAPGARMAVPAPPAPTPTAPRARGRARAPPPGADAASRARLLLGSQAIDAIAAAERALAARSAERAEIARLFHTGAVFLEVLQSTLAAEGGEAAGVALAPGTVARRRAATGLPPPLDTPRALERGGGGTRTGACAR